MKLYLLTGFLGAGKTTSLKNLITLFKDTKISVIVNEFGKEGIDGTLLMHLGVHLNEINNGSIFCSCRLDKFEEVLTETVKFAPDTILVEASGLSDPTNIKKILSGNQLFSDIDYCGCLCLVDAVNLKRVFETARVCKKQLSVADLILLNKIDIASEEQIAHTVELIKSHAPTAVIKQTSFGKIAPEWLEELSLIQDSDLSKMQIKDITLQKYLITIKDTFTRYQLIKFIQMFIEDTYRIKGFVSLNGEIFLIDCVGAEASVVPYHETLPREQKINCIVVLSGAKMPTGKSIDNACRWYQEFIIGVE